MNKKEILQKRRKLVASLPAPDEVLRGSLLERVVRHSKGCARCERGEGHKALVLTVTYPGGRNKQFGIPRAQKRMAARWLKNYKGWKQKMEQICELNHALLRPDE